MSAWSSSSSSSSSLKKEMLFFIMQFLDKEKFIDSIHRLEQESGIYFNMKYFEEKVLAGEWVEVIKYLSGFTKVEDNINSMAIYFEIFKHKYLEALDRKDKVEALKILMKDMEVFSRYCNDLYKELTRLLTLKNFRENEKFSEYGDIEASRGLMLIEVKKLIEANPVFHDKLVFPTLETSKLMTLISQRKAQKQRMDDDVNDKMIPKRELTRDVEPCQGISMPERATNKVARFIYTDKGPTMQLTHLVEPCRAITVPERAYATNKVAGLLYTRRGNGLLVLGSEGTLKIWKWTRNQQNPSGNATAKRVPHDWNPKTGFVMINDVPDVDVEEGVPCIAMTNNDAYVVSTIGGKITLFNLADFSVVATCVAPPRASTVFAFHPEENNVMAIANEDSSVIIYNVQEDKVVSKLRGHLNRVTGLAFSTRLNVLVSSDADTKLCVWHIDGGRIKGLARQVFVGDVSTCTDTQVEFDSDAVRLLVSNETQLAVYDAFKMDRLLQWFPKDFHAAPISCAAYSCNGQLVYASFCDGNVGVFDADTLRMKCRVSPSAYLSQDRANNSVYPLLIATHPQDPNQFSVGLSDGSVRVIEPPESKRRWGLDPPTPASSVSSCM